jgi:hypothetical protein
LGKEKIYKFKFLIVTQVRKNESIGFSIGFARNHRSGPAAAPAAAKKLGRGQLGDKKM